MYVSYGESWRTERESLISRSTQKSPSFSIRPQVLIFSNERLPSIEGTTRHYITMTAKNFSIKLFSQAIRNNSLASGQPFLKKIFKTSSSGSSTTSESTAGTGQAFRVRFSSGVHFRDTLSLKDYTPEEIQSCWYTYEGNQRIRRNCTKEIRKMNEGIKLEDKKYCSRGLEGHTTIGDAIKTRNRSLAITAVLDEQMIQWDNGILDEDSIAAIYCMASSSCQMWASIIGRRDHGMTKASSSGDKRSGVASRAA